MAELTQKDIDDILRLIDGSNFNELKLEMGDLKLEVRKGASTSPMQGAATTTAQSIEVSTPEPTKEVASVHAPVVASGGGSEIPAPLLGTFYRAPKPGADPFIQVGDTVTEDSVIGIIEVMKLMNSVPAGMAGVVTEILAENGQLVEHGQALVRIQPN